MQALGIVSGFGTGGAHGTCNRRQVSNGVDMCLGHMGGEYPGVNRATVVGPINVRDVCGCARSVYGGSLRGNAPRGVSRSLGHAYVIGKSWFAGLQGRLINLASETAYCLEGRAGRRNVLRR